MHSLRRAATPCMLAWLLLTPASALGAPPDREALLTRLDTMFAESGFNAEFGPVEQSRPGDFRIAFVNMTGRGLRTPARIEEVTISGADLAADGALSIERLAFARIAQSGQDERGRAHALTVDGGEIGGLYLADTQDDNARLVPDRKSEWQVGRVTVTVDGAIALLVDGIAGSAEPDAAREILVTTAQVGRWRIDPYALGEPRFARRAAQLEMLTLDLSFRLAVRWNAATGHLALETWRVEAPGLGAFDLKLVLDGYTGERARQMRNANVASAGNSGDGAAAMQAAGKELMAALGAISLVEGVLRFEDRSLVRRSLEARAGDEGTTVEELVELLPQMSLSFTQFLEMPEFSRQLADTLRAFLADPKSITITLKPAAPAPIAGMVGMALFSPAALIQQVGLAITTND